MAKPTKKTEMTLQDGWFVRSERIEGQCMSKYGDPDKMPVTYEVWKCVHRFFIVRAERKPAGKKGEQASEIRTLLLESPGQLSGVIQLDAEGMRSRDAADMAARVLQLSEQ